MRKTYTITKQRENWTASEHQKFLEAVELYVDATAVEELEGTRKNGMRCEECKRWKTTVPMRPENEPNLNREREDAHEKSVPVGPRRVVETRLRRWPGSTILTGRLCTTRLDTIETGKKSKHT